MNKWLISAIFAATAGISLAAAPLEQKEIQGIVSALSQALPGLKEKDVRAVRSAGLYEVTMDRGTAYVTPDGRFLLRGDLIEIASRRNLTTERQDDLRRELLGTLATSDSIVFGPAKPKHVVTVFTDVDCAYCRKMHKEIATFNQKGIAIRYYAFPAAGVGSESWKKAEAVWCARDRRQALTRAKQGENVARPSPCNAGSVARSYKAADRLGMEGTPLLVLEDGSLVSGYKSATELLSIIEARIAQRKGRGAVAKPKP